MKVPSLMRAVGYAHWSYQRYVKRRLPLKVQGLLSQAARSRPSQLGQKINAEFNFWRVKQSATRV